jgi:hypothetical protein
VFAAKVQDRKGISVFFIAYSTAPELVAVKKINLEELLSDEQKFERLKVPQPLRMH